MKTGLIQRLQNTGVVSAEGYLFEMERRGYLTAGEFVLEVAIVNPEALKEFHKDFQHAGSDVVVAFTYNGHREKMRIIRKEHLPESLNQAVGDLSCCSPADTLPHDRKASDLFQSGRHLWMHGSVTPRTNLPHSLGSALLKSI